MRTPYRPRRLGAAGPVLAVVVTLSAACTAAPHTIRTAGAPEDGGPPRLVAFGSCAEAGQRLKQAARMAVGPYGFGAPTTMADSARAATEAVAAPLSGQVPAYSGTTNHEDGVDEPDLVKTDGRRIVTVNGGVLRVVDAATHRFTGSLDLRGDPGVTHPVTWSRANMLLSGGRALVLMDETVLPYAGGPAGAPRGPRPVEPTAGPHGARLLLVDLSARPRLAGEYRIDGRFVDARRVGAVARVVVRSGPRIEFPSPTGTTTDAGRVAANRAAIDRSGIDAWLPRYAVTTGGRTRTGQVACERISRPSAYSGTAMITVLSFDLRRAALGDGDPVSVVADGDTVYATPTSLYVANDQRWRAYPMPWLDAPMPRRGEGATAVVPAQPRTGIYQFDTSAGRPRYIAAGSVPGWLLNQYAMSEWDGHLRVATTTAGPGSRSTTSSVYVLAREGGSLVRTGHVGGLGAGERIYAVRFAGPVGYVVTFRQTDPLYTIDLHDPRAPRVAGELKITGYSAFLQPVGGGRVVGIGQEAGGRGVVRGTQVSLFDLSDLGSPVRLARYHAPGGYSEAEFDPHAFLYWSPARLLVVPLVVPGPGSAAGSPGTPRSGALLLRLGAHTLDPVGGVDHAEARRYGAGQIRRALIIGATLWTVSAGGVKATDLASLNTIAWLPVA